MDGSDDGSGGYRPSPHPAGALPPHDHDRLPQQLPPPPTPVYTPYNPFLGTSSTHSYPSHPALPPSFKHNGSSHQNHLPDAAGDSLAASPTSSRKTSAAEYATLSALHGASMGGAVSGTGGEVGGVEATSPEPSSTLAAPKVTRKADRSCKTCRQRRVRCGREYPTCSRCKKRRDSCSYGEGVYVEETIEGSDQQKITELESKISLLEQQLRTATSLVSSRPPTAGSAAPSSVAPPSPSFTRSTLSSSIATCILELLPAPQPQYLAAFLAGEQGGQPTFDGSDQRLVGSALGDALTCYLLDASLLACDSRLAIFAPLTARIDVYKNRLRDLDATQQVSCAVLCALGARTSAHSPIFGVPTVSLPDGTPAPALFLTVGSRRESACQAMEARAKETAWAAGLLWPKSYEELEALVGLMGLSIHEENEAENSRFLVRQVVGAYIDLRHGELSRGVSHPASRTVGISAFMSDALASVSTGKPGIISASELTDYFATAGVEFPDLAQCRLGEIVDAELQTSLSSDAVNRLINTLFLHVMGCYRVYAQVTTPRRAGATSNLGFIRSLWLVLDQIHSSIQRIQQHLVSLTTPLLGAETDGHAINHAILLAVRADDILVVLIMHIHEYLLQKRNDAPHWAEREGDEELERTRAESTLRVYKCLKLLAFYCQLYFQSQDKHGAFHLLLQLNVCQNWTSLATLRIGQPGGPPSDEFESTEEEVEWFRQALELSLFYTPRTVSTLNALTSAIAASFPQNSAAPSSSSALTPSYRPSSAHQPHAPSAPQQSFPSPTTIPSQHNPTANTPTIQHQHQSVAAMYSHTTLSDNQHLHLSAGAPMPFLPHQNSSHNMQEDISMPFPLEVYGQTGFADHAADDLPGTSTDVRSAFRSVDFGELSLTPAVMAGSDGSNSSASLEDWMRRKH